MSINSGSNSPDNLARAIGAHLGPKNRPALLLSYVFLPQWEACAHRFGYRDWALDSGAFSAKEHGATISLAQYMDDCLRLLHPGCPDPPAEVFALDVIDDWRASRRNTEAMWKAGIPAIPCYHRGEPEDVLVGLARDYPKIALGGIAGLRHTKSKGKWVGQCFARVWPKRIHGFACAAKSMVLAFPWDSVDATSWQTGPTVWGSWQAYGGRCSVRGSTQNLQTEVQWYVKLEREMRGRWERHLREVP